MDILTNTISLLFRPRQKEIARFAQDADTIQHKQLLSLLSAARNTEWGLKYGYKNIRGYADFCERIPLQTYDDLKPYVTRMINGEKNILWPSVITKAVSTPSPSISGIIPTAISLPAKG